MKTTIDIPEPLLVEAKKLSKAENTTLRSLIEEGLRVIITKRKASRPFRLRKAGFKGKGLQKKFQDGDWDKIRSAVYEGRGG